MKMGKKKLFSRLEISENVDHSEYGMGVLNLFMPVEPEKALLFGWYLPNKKTHFENINGEILIRINTTTSLDLMLFSSAILTNVLDPD